MKFDSFSPAGAARIRRLRALAGAVLIASGLTALPHADASAAAAATAPAAVHSKQDAADVARVQKYLNSLRTMTARFLQYGPDGSTAEGTLYLSRPGRLRVEYDPPTPVLIVSDGRLVHYYDSELRQVSTVRLSETPAAVLVRDKYDFSKDIRIIALQRGPGVLRVTLQDVDNPDTGLMAALRVAIEALFFRSLLRNSRAHVSDNRLEFSAARLLWLAALALHWSLLIIVLRHLRFALQPVPFFVPLLETFDGILQIGAPALLITDILVVAALLFLLGRRLVNPLLRYLSLFTDYFALLLLLGIVLSGIAMRYGARVDIVSVKALVLGLAAFRPVPPMAPNPLFLTHFFLVSALAIYLPFSKLVHFGGVFLSPTRNLANNSRRVRHVNPWNHAVPTHTYAEWEAENADVMRAAGLPLDGADHV